MFKENIAILRNIKEYMQEEVAEKMVFLGRLIQDGKRETLFLMWNAVRN